MMKIVLLEACIVWENKEKNIKILEQDLEEILCHCKPDLVCLPEMSFTGFSMNVEVTKDVGARTVHRIQELSKKYETLIAFGWVEHAPDGYKNHYSIVNSDCIQLDYEKIHPFRYGGEADVFTGGEELKTAHIKDFCVGVQICYDLRFPETFQILSKKADMILVPANWPQVRQEHWDVIIRARAMENQVYLAGINCRGMMNGMKYDGHSVLLAPDGSCCEGTRIALRSENIIYIYESENHTSDYRSQFPVKQDRREELYYRLWAETEKMR